MLRRFLPRSLYARILLIVILPIFITQSVVTYIFFARHWDLVTANLSANVAGQIALVTRLYNDAETDEERSAILLRAKDDLQLSVRHDKTAFLPQQDDLSIFNVYNSTFDRRLGEALATPYWFNTRSWPAFVEVRVIANDGQLVFFAYRDRVFATTGPIFVAWLIGTSVLLGAIAVIFMKNQIRSILRLASAAEAFGRGRDAPDYRPTGATEVRKAGYAFIAMRERLKRFVEQRTLMLSGVSHDLRTPLTRIKLALEMQPPTAEVDDLKKDVLEMERMVEAYLEFARDDAEDEPPEPFRLSSVVNELVGDAARAGRNIETNVPERLEITASRSALKRALSNLVQNALRFASHVAISARKTDRKVDIYVDDDGPGIDPENYEVVFRPFMRLSDRSGDGMGLGMTVVRDIARAHGGDATLDRSPMGGLRARISLPL